MTSRNGSRLTYQPGQAPPVISTVCVSGVAGLERRAQLGDLRRLQVRLAAHDGGDAGGVVASGVGVVGQARGHEQRAQVGVAETERTVVVRVARDGFGRIAGVVHQDFLRGDDDGAGVAIGFDVEGSVGRELHQVQRRQVAGGVVEEHVLAARIAGVDARGVLRGVPAIGGGVVLHAGIAAVPGGVGDLAQQVARLEGLDGAAVFHGLGAEFAVAHDGVHEVVGHAHGVVGVLEEHRRVGLGVGAGAVIAVLDQRPGFGFFFLLALDEVNDVRVVHVEDDHLGGAAGLASGLDDAGEGVEALHEAERAAGGSAAGERLGGGAQRREVGAGARAPLEEHALGLGQRQDAVQRIVDRVDEAGGALRLGVADRAEFDLLLGGVPVPVLRLRVGLDAVAAHVEPHRRVEGGLLLQEQVRELVVEDGGVVGGRKYPPLMPQSRMVSATRETSWRTPVSRSGVSMVPCRYLLATMLVAVIDQSLGVSTSFCSKITPPWASVIWARRSSHSISS